LRWRRSGRANPDRRWKKKRGRARYGLGRPGDRREKEFGLKGKIKEWERGVGKEKENKGENMKEKGIFA